MTEDGDTIVAADAVRIIDSKVQKKSRSPRSKSKLDTTAEPVSGGGDDTGKSSDTLKRPKKPRPPRIRKPKVPNDSSDPANSVAQLSSKPLNFAPPKSFASNGPTRSGKKAKTALSIAPSNSESSQPPAKERTADVKSGNVATAGRPSLFAPVVDPFPTISDQKLSQGLESLSLNSTASTKKSSGTKDPIQRKVKKENASGPIHDSVPSKSDELSVSSGVARPADPVETVRSRAKRDPSAKRGGPGRTRIRKEREQIPASIFVNANVTRGPHGRLVRTLIEKSIQTEDPDHVDGPADETVVFQGRNHHDSAAPPLNTSLAENGRIEDQASSKKERKNVASAQQERQNAKEDNTFGSQESRKRRPFFAEHISLKEAKDGVKTGRYLKGILRISPKARSDAWVTTKSPEVVDGDALVSGDRDRNRALNGDEVVIELIEATTQSAENDSTTQMANSSELKHAGRTRAKVVHVLSKRPLNRISGFIRPPGWVYGLKKQDERALIESDAKKSTCLFYPQDQRIPWLIIARHDLPSEMQGNDWIFQILQKQNTIFAARLVSWQAQNKQPRGVIVDELGAVGNIHAETAAILADCDVDIRDHPMSALECLPVTPWSISQEEVKKRRDFRKDRVCTIDPETARDLDDALSVRPLGDGKYEIGVHIADVSHFIEQDNALDKIARDRATTVYMVQKAIPMLPRLLCEELCSLNPAVDRLAFSVTWTMNEDGEEVGPRWYGRSVIRSAVRFAYGEAQNVLDGQSWAEGVGKAIDGGHTEEEITRDLRVLLRMSKAMRAKRFEAGALTISAFKLNFKLNKDGLPGVAEVYQLRDANRLIEEFMLKANISVAEKIVDAFPEQALLRHHPPPKDRPLMEFVNYARKLGIHIDASSSSSLQDSFNQLSELAKENPMVSILQNNAVRSMQKAMYMCTGMHEDHEEWAHYALAVPLYTHFTSPIRRYADVVVHRLLDRALQQREAGFEAEECEVWATNCNHRKENARLAQDRSSMLYLCAFIEEHCREHQLQQTDTGMIVDAVVISIKDRSLDLIVPSMALEKRLYYDDSFAIQSFTFNATKESVEVHWHTLEERLTAITAYEDAIDSGALDNAPESNRDKNKKSKDAATANHEQSQGETHLSTGSQASGLTSTIVALDKIKVWLRGDFSVSPCQVSAGFMLPQKT